MKFSIILPTYNRAARVVNAIQSVIDQTLKDWELIVIDDGSTDNTQEVINDFSESDKRIKYYWQENQERSAARNNGIERATGDFIMFLDSDDYFENNHLQQISDFIYKQTEDYGFFFTNFKIKDQDGLREGESVQYDSSKSFLAYLIANPICTSRGIISNYVSRKFKFDTNIYIGEDTELWSRISKETKVKQIPINTYVLVEHNERSLNQEEVKVYDQHIITLKKIKRLLTTKEEKTSYYNTLSYATFKKGNVLLGLNKKIKAFQCFLRAFLLAPKHRTKEKIFKMYESLFKWK